MKIYRQTYKKIRKFRRHFQLLEVMIAIFILLVCAAPAMQIYTSMFKGQQTIVRENQRDHLARLIHAKVTEQLYKRAIPLEQFVEAKQTPVDDPELEQKLKDLSYKAYYSVSIAAKTPSKGEEKPNKYLVQLVITIRDVSSNPPSRASVKQIENQDTRDTFYDYLVYIDAGGGNKKNNQAPDPKNSDQKQGTPPKSISGQSASDKTAKDNS